MFKKVNEYQAELMVALVLVQIPIDFLLDAFSITSLMILKGDILKNLDIQQKQDMAMLFLKIGHYGTLILEIFWGLWLIPFGQLVYKSGLIPRIFGVFLILNGIALHFDVDYIYIATKLSGINRKIYISFFIRRVSNNAMAFD